MNSYFIGFMLGILILSIVAFFITYFVSKNKKKAIVVAAIAFFAIFAIRMIINPAFIDGFKAGFSDTDTSTEKEAEDEPEPMYHSFGDISFQLNQETNEYELIESYDELSFEDIDENGEWIDWTDEEKKDFWNKFVYESPWEQDFFQEWASSDFVSLSRLSVQDSVYSTTDDFISEFAESQDYLERNDFTLNDAHACTFYFDSVPDELDYPDDSATVFYYNDYFYIISAVAILGDIYTITEEAIDGIVFN